MTTEQCGQDQLPIGLFDSGVGGLTVLDAMRRLMPGEGSKTMKRRSR